MNNRELYLAWVRSKYPMQYMTALRQMTGKPRSLGGLGDDLLSSFTAPDISANVDVTTVAPDVQNAIAATDTSPTGQTWFDTFTNAVSNVAQTYLQTSAQQNLLSINTQRARQGLPPLTASGVPVTATSLMPANASIISLERRIAGSVSPSTLLYVGIGAVGLIMLMQPRRARR